MKFDAAVMHAVNAPLAVEQVELAPLAPDDVLVKIMATGLCHTDLEALQGSLAYPMPIVLGHEGAGIVEAIGRDVTGLRVGDHVICSWNPHCGHCFHCERDEPILCEPFIRHQPKGLLLDGTTRLRHDGQPIHHFFTTSTHAEYTIIPRSGAIRVPKDIAFDRACVIGCAVMTGVGAVVRKAKVEAGSSVVVIGCGAVGLNALQGARIAAAARIIGVDKGSAKLERAKAFGATDVVDAGDADALGQIRALTAGRGADYVFEAAGNRATLRLSVEAARTGGNVVWLGKLGVNEETSFRWGALMGEKRIVRSSYGNARPERDFPWIVDAYMKGAIKLDELVTARIALREINEGFAALARGEGIRTVITFD